MNKSDMKIWKNNLFIIKFFILYFYKRILRKICSIVLSGGSSCKALIGWFIVNLVSGERIAADWQWELSSDFEGRHEIVVESEAG